MVSTPPFAESVTEGDVKWEKGERERTTSSWVAFGAYFEEGKSFFLFFFSGGVICGHVSLNSIVYDNYESWRTGTLKTINKVTNVDTNYHAIS